MSWRKTSNLHPKWIFLLGDAETDKCCAEMERLYMINTYVNYCLCMKCKF